MSIASKNSVLPFEIAVTDLSVRDQKAPTFLAANSNDHISAIADLDTRSFIVFELGIMLIYRGKGTTHGIGQPNYFLRTSMIQCLQDGGNDCERPIPFGKMEKEIHISAAQSNFIEQSPDRKRFRLL